MAESVLLLKFSSAGFPAALRGFAVFFATAVTALVGHVLVVVGASPNEQMVWTDTERIIAMVQDAQSVRDFPVMEFPTNSVGVSASYQLAVPSADCGGSPYPAIAKFRAMNRHGTSLVDFSPEQDFKRFAFSASVTTSWATEPTFAHFDVARVGKNHVQATFALALAINGFAHWHNL